MISFRQFQQLDQNTKIQLLWLDGIFLDLSRQEAGLRADLYALNEYYVEIYFDQRTDDPVYIKSFTDLRRLDPYLHQMDITPFMQGNDGFWM